MRRSALLFRALLAASLSCPVCAAGLESSSLPPIVLRINQVSVAASGLPSPGGTSAGTAKEVFWLLATSVLTFGVPLLDLPNVLERRAADADSARLCLDSWKAILDGPKPWLNSADVQEFVLQTIRVEAARLVANRTRPVVVEVASGGTDDARRKEAIGEIGVRLSVPSVVLVDVSLGVEPSSPGCAALFRVKADLHVEPTAAAKQGMPPSASPSLPTIGKSEAVDVRRWAADPEVGRQALRLALLQIAEEIVQAYPWPPGDENLPSLPPPTGQGAAVGTGSER